VSDTGVVAAGGLVLQDGEYSIETVASGGEDSATGLLPGGGFVVLDTAVTPDLEAEGVARDLVRAVQQARREAGLDVSDRISLTISAGAAAADAARTHAGMIRRETLATSLDVHEAEVAHPVIEISRA
jgi:isoleucyl-tRNA synthetase